jgi:hypothetical protein
MVFVVAVRVLILVSSLFAKLKISRRLTEKNKALQWFDFS